LNGRHNKGTATNILMFDGSVQKMLRSELPTDGAAFWDPSPDQLTLKWPNPKWRLDQR
jgi:prepilin-type processing-associated H-X9-DG protein